jgi:hypothetical protein
VVVKPYDLIPLGKDVAGNNISFRCIASNGIAAKNGTTTFDKTLIQAKNKPDQNARSVVLILEYGDFRYFLGGDIGGLGDKDGGNWGDNVDDRPFNIHSSHPNIETAVTAALAKMYPVLVPLRKKIAGHMCCFFANHHGSASSNDVFLLEQVRPKVLTCSAGVKVRFHFHPTQQLFRRTDSTGGYSPSWQKPGKTSAREDTIVNSIDGYYMTEVAKDGKYGTKKKKDFIRTFPNGKIVGDIIVRPLAGVFPAAANIQIQVYGTGDLTAASVQSKELRDVYAGANTAPYPIGPFLHTCDLH